MNSKDGNPSPAAGSIHGHSNIDDYTQQDEQINIDGGRNSVVKVLRANQKNLLNDFVIGIFPIRNAPPIEIRNVFRIITAQEGGRAEVIRDQKKKENFLWVVAPKFQLPHIEAALKALDEAWLKDDFDGATETYYKAKFRDIREVHALATIAASAALRSAGEDNNVDLDRVNNAALFIGEPYRGESYLKYAKQVDQPIPQILLDATVYEVEVSKETRIGVDYIAWKNGPGRNLFEAIYWRGRNDQRARNSSSVFDPFAPPRLPVVGEADVPNPSVLVSGKYYAFNYLLTSAWLDFLVGSGRARLLARGKVLAKNGETGTLSATDQELHFKVWPDETTTPASGLIPTFPLADKDPKKDNDLPIHNRTLTKDGKVTIGFVMTVRGLIAQETTELQITLNLSQIVGQTPAGTPQVRTHTLSTTVLVADGQPICISGLRRTEDVKNTAKAPIIGSLPIVGYLFGHEATSRHETEMVVVLVPRIRLGSEADLELASEEDKLVRQQVERQAQLRLPKTQFGFDQWLLDTPYTQADRRPVPAATPEKEQPKQ